MRKNEESFQTLRDYFSEDVDVHFIGNDKAIMQLRDLFSSTDPVFRDSPDLYFVKDNLVLLVEHFEFDCFHNTKKGSSYRRKEAQILEKPDRIDYMSNTLVKHSIIQGAASFEDYISNVKRAFNKHYRKIDKYINSLKKEGIIVENYSIFKTMFLIEDVSPFGTLMIGNKASKELHAVNLLFCKDFLDVLQISPRVDYILFCSKPFGERSIWFIDRMEIEVYYDKVIEYEAEGFLLPTIHCVELELSV